MKKYADNGTSIIDQETGSVIPKDTNNADYQKYLQWVKDGNEPEMIENKATE